MTRGEDHRLAEAKAMPIDKVADLLAIAGLKRAGHELTGPCPLCGGDDRFSISIRKNLFLCRICGTSGDQLRLVEFVRGIDFRAALDWLCGPSHEISDAERAERAARARAHAESRARDNDRYRAAARKAAFAIWSEGHQPEATPVRDYLTRRGIPAAVLPALPACLRYHPACPYMVQDGKTAWREIHRGPAMLAAIQGPDGKFAGVHRTWLDLADPKGKAQITDPVTGAAQKAKKTLGSKKGGAIRLVPKPYLFAPGPAQMVMAEGIETTLSALVSGACRDAAFWCGIDLGNMAGQRLLGKGRTFDGIPDLTDAEAFVPPPWVRDLIFVQDGDSEPRLTRAKLLSGCRRAMVTIGGLKARIVPVPDGKDLNDIVMEGRAQ